MANLKRKPEASECELDPKQSKADDDLLVKPVLVSNLLLRYVMMSWFLSKTYPSFRSTHPKFSTNPRNNMGWLSLERCMMVGGGFVASIAKKLSRHAGTYQQPRGNDRWCRGWMDCIMHRATTGLVRKMAKAYYKAGKALMFSKKFAIGASFLEKAIQLDHNGAKALFAYFLVRGREGLSADPGRASDLASDGAAKNCQLCRLFLSIDCSANLLDAIYFGDSGFNARYWLSKAMKPHMRNDDHDLAFMLYHLAQVQILLPKFTKYHPPCNLTLQEAPKKAMSLLMSNPSTFLDCEIQFRVAMMCKEMNDKEQAVIHLTNAANQGHPEALFNLGRMYYHGWGIPEDVERGMDLMEQAKKAGSESPKNWGYIKK